SSRTSSSATTRAERGSTCPATCDLLHRDRFDLSKIRDAGQRLEDAVLDERGHAFGPGLREHLGHAAPRLDEAFDLVADDEQLVDARAASVPRAIAPRAALAARQHEVVGVSKTEGLERLLAVGVGQLLVLRALGMVGLPAPLADAFDESLREDPEQ